MSDYEYQHDPLNEAFAEDDDEDYLPVGSHLLPQEYKDFLVKWNREIGAKIGYWVTSKKEYAVKYPVEHAEFIAENKRLSTKYAAEVEAVKQYQKEHPEESE